MFLDEIAHLEVLRARYKRRDSLLDRTTFAGLEYDTDLVSSQGIAVTLFALPTTTRAQISAAKRDARNKRDVVCFYVERIPAEWAEGKDGAQ